MTTGHPFRFVSVGESVVVVEFEERIDRDINAGATALARRVRGLSLAGVRDVVPTFRSVAVYFDPLLTDYESLIVQLKQHVTAPDLFAARESDSTEPIRVPVCYGGDFGPDLAEVAKFAGVTESEAAQIHAGTTYRVFMLGFLPGFAYMGTVDSRIAAPRRSTPRTRVPAGSVAIAGPQTGIYPSESPGGWQLIGRTPLCPFDPLRASPSVFSAGDLVRFFPIQAADFGS